MFESPSTYLPSSLSKEEQITDKLISRVRHSIGIAACVTKFGWPMMLHVPQSRDLLVRNAADILQREGVSMFVFYHSIVKRDFFLFVWVLKSGFFGCR